MDFVEEVMKRMQAKRSKHVEQFMKHKDVYQKAVDAGASIRAMYEVARASKMFTGGQTTFAKLVKEYCKLRSQNGEQKTKAI